jgi:hypothetical protein
MPENLDDEQVDRMLHAALGGMTQHEALIQASLADAANTEARQEAIAKNRERALKLLAAIEGPQD